MKPADYVGATYAQYDCFALVREVAECCFGRRYPDIDWHARGSVLTVNDQLGQGHWVLISDPEPGDVMTLSPTPGSAGHVGLVLEGGWVLHNDRKLGAIIQNADGLRRSGYIYRNTYRWMP